MIPYFARELSFLWVASISALLQCYLEDFNPSFLPCMGPKLQLIITMRPSLSVNAGMSSYCAYSNIIGYFINDRGWRKSVRREGNRKVPCRSRHHLDIINFLLPTIPADRYSQVWWILLLLMSRCYRWAHRLDIPAPRLHRKSCKIHSSSYSRRQKIRNTGHWISYVVKDWNS